MGNRKDCCSRFRLLRFTGTNRTKEEGSLCSCPHKKRQYWPKHLPGDNVIAHFTGKQVGDADAIRGELDGIPFHIFAMKEPDYTMQIMSTYGTLERKGIEKKRHWMEGGTKHVTTFCYPEVVHNHYAFHDMIDNHNSQPMHPISLEETWMTTRWPNHVFCFLLAVSVVNVQNAGEYFCALQKVDALSARKLIAQQLIDNKYMRTVEERPSTGKNSKMGDWLLARANIKPGDASASLPVLGHTVNALQE